MNDKLKEIDKAIKKINKKFDDPLIMRMDDGEFPDIESWSTGLVGLDYIIGIGGLPKGRIMELFGAEGVGKTTLCYMIAAEVQRNNGVVLFVDAEHSGDPRYAKEFGVDFSKIILSQPDTGEQAFEIITTLIKTGKIDLVIVDSAAALTPEGELEGDDIASQKQLGQQAAMFSQALRNIKSFVRKYNVTLLFTNQIRDKIGVYYGSKESTPCGHGLKFYSKLRLRMGYSGTIKSGALRLGHKVKIKTVRNNLAPPYQEWEGDLIWGKGFDKVADLVWLAHKIGVINRSGNRYLLDDERIALGYSKTVKTVREDENLLKRISDKVKNG